MSRPHRRRSALVVALLGVLATVGSLLTIAPVGAAGAAGSGSRDLYLVVLEGPGTAGRPSLLPAAFVPVDLLAQQDAVLDSVDAAAPVYRWTTALNGVAVELTAAQARDLAADPRVADVERNAVRPLAGVADRAALGRSTRPDPRGGRGVVIGVIDSGLDADSPLFASSPGLGRRPAGYRGACSVAEGWGADACSDKVVGGDWFVAGFGEDAVRSGSALSPADDDGHGTALASIAAGNPGVTVRTGPTDLGRFSGEAPQARIAAYKACWTAPDPADDGCSTADLVAAIDRATADGVDVLTLAVGGPSDTIDAVDLALLGAVEGGAVVVAAAGNEGDRAYSAHPVPWVTTVGASAGIRRPGVLRLPDGRRLTGVMTATRDAGPARVVVGSRVPAPGYSARAAGQCVPGSLDARRVRDAIVLCERGLVGRVDKSAAVALADGAGMVLANTRRQPLETDLHRVPTLHVDRATGLALRRWALRHPAAEVRLDALPVRSAPARVLPFSSAGDPSISVVKPDVLAPGAGVIAATTGRRWEFLSGTSAATATVAGVAATLLSHGMGPAEVRSALATTAREVPGAAVRRAGAGVVDAAAARRPGLALQVPATAYRRWLDGERSALDLPAIVLTAAAPVLTDTRTITNTTGRRLYFSSSAGGFTSHRAIVTPAAVRLAPGESARFRVLLLGPAVADDGWVLWRGATGTRTRIPVVVNR